MFPSVFGSHHHIMTLSRLLALALLAALAVAGAAAPTAQSIPDWAAPSAPAAPAEQMQAVPCPPGQTGDPCAGGVPAQVPLDGGLSLLALAGGAYAVRKLRQS